jgi:hypothetical protein
MLKPTDGGCQAKDAPFGYCAGPQRRRRAELVSETIRRPGEEDPLGSFHASDARLVWPDSLVVT